MDQLSAITKLVARVRWRLRWQTALRRLLTVGGCGLLGFGITVLLVKTRALPTDATIIAAVAASTLAVVALASGLLRRLDAVRLAAALDEAGGLHSRLGSALAFAREPEPTALQRAAIEDALGVVARANPRLASPWQWGTFVVGAVVAAVALALALPAVYVFDFPVGRAAATATSGLAPLPGLPARDKPALTELDVAQLEELAEELAEAVAATADADARALLEALDELVAAIAEGRVTPEEAHARLASLEQAREEWLDEHARDLAEVETALREAAEKIRRPHEDVAPLLDALEEQDLAEAAARLERLAAQLDEEAPDKRSDKRLARDLEALARELESARQRAEAEARRDRDRLKQQEQDEPDRVTRRDRDRLKERERELEELRREEQQLSQARRQLERLQRELDEGARDVARRQQQEQGGQGASADALRRAADIMRRLSEQGAGRQQLRSADGRMGELRELLRRSGQRGQQQAGRQRGHGEQAGQQGEQGEQQGGQQGGQGEQGEGGQGGQQDALERFLVEAGGGGKGGANSKSGGESGEGGDAKGGAVALKPGRGGEDGMVLLGPGQGGGPRARAPGQGGGQAGAEASEGEGAGVGHDPRLLGERTHLDVATRDDFVKGESGAGPSQSRVIFSAASRGFASRAYRDVHQDYSEVVEDALDRQEIPPGQRTYVRRYFDLIRPR